MRDVAWLLLLSMAGAVAALSVRSDRQGTRVERPPHAMAAGKAAVSPRPPLPAPPRPRDVRKAIRRVFGETVTVDPARAAAGDFNGDGSEDLAAGARAVPALLDGLNHELANWTVQDATASRPDRVTVAREDALLAVVHGYGVAGWRSPQARQCYLVRHAAERPRVVRDAHALAHVLVDDAPGHPGFLYWSGSRYVWTAGAGAAPGR